MNGKHLFSILTGIVVIGGLALLITKLLSNSKGTDIKKETNEHATKETKTNNLSADTENTDHIITNSISNIGNRHHIAADEITDILNDITTKTVKDVNSKNDEKTDEIFEELNNL